jgi:hypothetical protein
VNLIRAISTQKEDDMNQQLVDLLSGLNDKFDDKRQFLILQLLTETFEEFAKRRDAILDILARKRPTINVFSS